jgi:hypothetical protein
VSNPATIKRTRRLGNPFDASVEVRMYSTEKAKLFEEAKARGLSASDLVRTQLGALIAAEPPQAAPTPDGAANGGSGLTTQPVDLAEAIADVTNTTWGYATLQIKLGKVTVGGEPWTETMIPASRLTDVALNGQPLPIESV